MDEDRRIALSPRHSVYLGPEFLAFVETAPQRDFVVRTLAQRMAGSMPLMSAELVIAGVETRQRFPLARTYPLHFRKTYFPGRMHGDPKDEYDNQLRASELIDVLPPIGFESRVFRSCMLPGPPYHRLSPFGTEPEESNLVAAEKLDLATAAGLWRFLENAFDQLRALHAGGLAHGDAELHNFIVVPSPLEIVVIDFESAIRKAALDEAAWVARCQADLDPLLREAVFLQCSLGPQPGDLARLADARMVDLFKDPDRFRRAIARPGHGGG